MAIVICMYCHGNCYVTIWDDEAKTYKKIVCPACRGKGVIDTSTLSV